MSMEIIQSAATELLVNVALAVLALAGAYAVYYIRLGTSKLKAQTAQIEDASTRKVLDDALEDVANLATLSVGAMEQTTAKALREAVKGGKASREELVALGKQVFDEVNDYFYRRSVCQATYKYRVIVCRYSFYTYFLCIRCR